MVNIKRSNIASLKVIVFWLPFRVFLAKQSPSVIYVEAAACPREKDTNLGPKRHGFFS